MSAATVISCQLPTGFAFDPDVLPRFEAGLDPRHPERNAIPARVLGYGEISTVFEIQAPGLAGLAFKRLPIFSTVEEMRRYEAVYSEYNRLLAGVVGLAMPAHGYLAFVASGGSPIFYIIQQQLPGAGIGNRVIHDLPAAEVAELCRRVLTELRKVWEFNASQDRMQIGIDGQISNWALAAGPGDLGGRLLYVDTSTPLFRVAGVEQLDTELFLRSAPSFLRWLLRLLFVKDVVNRYYDLRLVVVDLVANFYKEGLAHLVPGLVAAANAFLAGEKVGAGLAPLSEAEVRAYYRQDATIWRTYLAARKLDRVLQTRLLRRRYPYILPAAIRR